MKFNTGDFVDVEVGKEDNESETLHPSVIDEVNMWTPLLEVLTQGLPVPFDPVRHVQKIEKAEKRSGADYTAIKNCCTSISEIKEVKYFREPIFAILNRIIKITGLNVKEIEYRDENI